MVRLRSGFTLIELLVVIAIIATLVAILLPAVQRARESARNITCKNHLKQLGLALHNYHETHRTFPRGNFEVAGSLDGDGNRSWKGYAVHVMLLPFVEQAAVYDQIDFTKNMDATPNSITKQTVIATFLCPSDISLIQNGVSRDQGPGNNYVFSTGPSVWWFQPGNASGAPYPPQSLPDLDHQVGIFNYRLNVRISEITDGTSQTIAASELIKGDGDRTTYNLIPGTYTLGDTVRDGAVPAGMAKSFPTRADVETWGANCLTASTASSSKPRGDTGTNWMRGDIGQTLFNTLDVPNSKHPNCVACAGCGANTDRANFPARSRHSGGVNVLMADGQVRFVGDSIDFTLWQNLGARNDGNVVGEY